MTNIIIDISSPKVHKTLATLNNDEQRAFFRVLKKISQLSWDSLYIDKGINWEKIKSQQTKSGDNIYSFRFSKKIRGTAYRKGHYMVLLNLFPDHDGAYE